MTRFFVITVLLLAACTALTTASASGRRVVQHSAISNNVAVDPAHDCDRCVQAVEKIHNAVVNPSVVGDARQAIELICQLRVDQQQRAECTQTLDSLVDKIAANIDQKLANPLEVCQQNSLCNAQICDKCLTGVAQFNTELLRAGGIKQQLTLVASGYFCEKLPEFLKDICFRQVNAAINNTLEKVEQKTKNPENLCQELNVCPAAAAVANYISDEEDDEFEAIIHDTSFQLLADGVTQPCAICEGLGIAIYIAILQGKNETFIEGRLDSICERLPGQLGVACKKFIDEKLETFIPAVRKCNGNIRAACRTIGLCTNNNEAIQEDTHRVVVQSVDDVIEKEIMKNTAGNKNDYPCSVCQGLGIAIYVAQLEGKNQTQIEQRLEMICSRLPAKVRQTCKDFVDQKLEVFIPAVKEAKGNIRDACKKVGYCNDSKIKLQYFTRN